MSLRIRARPENGIRRVGVHHPAEPVVYPEDHFTPSEIEILRNDPDLIVELLDSDFLTPGEREQLERLHPLGSLNAPDVGQAPASKPDGGSAEQSAAEGDEPASEDTPAEDLSDREPMATPSDAHPSAGAHVGRRRR